MSSVDTNQPLGTPTWIDLAVPDLDRARSFYGSVFAWTFDDGDCLLRGLPVAGLHQDPDATSAWLVHLATDDCAATAGAVTSAGGKLLRPPHDVGTRGRAALAVDPSGTPFGLWQGATFPGARLVNEPDTLVRNDLITPTAPPARAFYRTVFAFTLDGNPDLAEADFTFLRRPDGHEVGGIFHQPDAPASFWATTFEVADADASATNALNSGGKVTAVTDTQYGRMATVTDPFGAEFTVIARP
ncbi:VOC family protein [Amycolatopsis rhabdoformis]|uniref:VOC family protein n=1 Tax=Amycolatopsis rhabdoformis TaxID=1448059 RepID=A0ABZ1HYK0_9PSEU|nr:VOC family protein [Amycolatopsis rhabdoformis]WSE26455.1 VOC family protein [Amycolatopsis rhabdoformis]